MPDLRVKEQDLTTNRSYDLTSNYVLIADSLAEALEGAVPVEITDISVLTYPVVSKRNIKTYASTTAEYVVSENTYNFINEVLTLGGQIILTNAYSDSTVDFISDRNQFDIKFLLVDEEADTVDEEGNVTEAAEQKDLVNALAIADTRKDCLVVLTAKEHLLQESTQNILREEVSYIDEDFFKDEKAKVQGKYVTALYGKFDDITAGQGYILAYLNALATNTNAAWWATAGATRGYIPGHTTTEFITESEMKRMEPRTASSTVISEAPIAVNPILKIRNVGTRIFGARTCLPNANVLISSGDEEYVDTSADQLIASSFTTTRILVCDIKKALYNAYIQYDFEQESDELWSEFTTTVNTLLDQMKTARAITGYKWKEVASSERAKITAILRIAAVEPVEDFDVTIQIGDTLEVSTVE